MKGELLRRYVNRVDHRMERANGYTKAQVQEADQANREHHFIQTSIQKLQRKCQSKLKERNEYLKNYRNQVENQVDTYTHKSYIEEAKTKKKDAEVSKLTKRAEEKKKKDGALMAFYFEVSKTDNIIKRIESAFKVQFKDG